MPSSPRPGRLAFAAAFLAALAGFAGRGLIAGRLPNQPEILAAFVRDAPALVPDTNMPAMPLTEEESRDVAAYLYTLGAR